MHYRSLSPKLKLSRGLKLPASVTLFRLGLFGTGLVHASLAIGMASVLFPSASGLVSTFFIAFGLLPTFNRLLDENAHAIWDKAEHPIAANAKTVLGLFAIFLGIFTVYFFLASYLSAEKAQSVFEKQLAGVSPLSRLTTQDFDDFMMILKHNVVVLYVFFFISIVYQLGAMFVLAWNASVWGAVFGFLLQAHALPTEVMRVAPISGGHEVGFSSYQSGLLVLSFLPHLSLEAVGYIVAAMSGLFLGKALRRYTIDSAEFTRVMNACFLLFLLSPLMISVAAWLESHCFPVWLNSVIQLD